MLFFNLQRKRKRMSLEEDDEPALKDESMADDSEIYDEFYEHCKYTLLKHY